ncbi:MAG TPA: DEAD/DEAH box helicase, partial [Usitatibacter sp.]|nr:DEAD/DEAH box helicase [Usitatibacter sp.]
MTMPKEEGAFAALGLAPKIVAALTALGYEEPTPIQRETIPPLIAGRDLLGQAATGTGKTAAFALPILQRIVNEGRPEGPTALVLVPTRELAMQVAEAVHRYGKALGVRVLPVYGGQPIGRQLHALRAGVDVVIATPGRALDHLRRGSLALGTVRVVVLDEADEMLDMGFAEDIEAVLAESPAERQTVLFSATMPPRIEAIAKRNQRNPLRIRIAKAPTKAGEAPKVRQQAYLVKRDAKMMALARVLDLESPKAAIVFCRTRTEVDELADTLNGRGYPSQPLHGGMSQEQRDRVMKQLRAGKAELLIATDVAARGLDVEQLTHVINYDLPNAPEAYVHRIGRVGRAGREGVAITFVEPREHHQLRNIERITKQKIELAQVPTIADLQARRLEVTQAALREAILDEGKERYRVVVDALSGEFDVVEIAMAAIKLVHEASGADGEEGPAPAPAEEARAPVEPMMARLYIAAGREAGIRPQDLVGAIANEAGVTGKAIGAIQITDRYSLVDVSEESAARVIKALRATKLRGKKVSVRRDH